jgi:hypothetical protein
VTSSATYLKTVPRRNKKYQTVLKSSVTTAMRSDIELEIVHFLDQTNSHAVTARSRVTALRSAQSLALLRALNAANVVRRVILARTAQQLQVMEVAAATVARMVILPKTVFPPNSRHCIVANVLGTEPRNPATMKCRNCDEMVCSPQRIKVTQLTRQRVMVAEIAHCLVTVSLVLDLNLLVQQLTVSQDSRVECSNCKKS